MKDLVHVGRVGGTRGVYVSSLVLGALGIAAGQLLQPEIVKACVCAGPAWSVALVSVEGPEGSPDHGEYWPQEGSFSQSVSGDQPYAHLSFVQNGHSHWLSIEAHDD